MAKDPLNPVGWTLQHDNSAGPYEATYPKNPGPSPIKGRTLTTIFEPPAIVRLKSGNRSAVLKAKARIAGGVQVFVAPGTLASVSDGSAVKTERAHFGSYFWHVLRTNGAVVLTLLGFLLTAASALITLSLAIGKVIVLIPVGDAGVVASLITAAVLGILGTAANVCLAVWKLL